MFGRTGSARKVWRVYDVSILFKDLTCFARNGMVFSSEKELADQMFELLEGFPNNAKLAQLRAGVKGFSVRVCMLYSKACC